MDIAELFARGVQHHQAGEYRSAEQHYRQVLQVEPRHADAWHLLGMLAHEANRQDLALEYIGRAISLLPDRPAFHGNLGLVYKAAGRLPEAVQALREAIRLRPDYSGAFCNLGVVLQEQGALTDSVACLERAIELQPDLAAAYLNLGATHAAQQRWADAELRYQQAVRLSPQLAEAHYGLGCVCEALRRPAEAIPHYRRAVEIRPDYAAAWNNLGVVQQAQGLARESLASFSEATRLLPDHASAHANMANVLSALDRNDEALAAVERGLAVAPGLTEGHSNRGLILQTLGRVDEAAAAFRQAVLHDPASAEAHSNLLMETHYLTEIDAAASFREHCEWARIHADPLPVRTEFANDRDPTRRLRIGYVSPDFHKHPAAAFLEPIFAHHDHQQYEIFAYSDVARPDAITERFQQYADHWIPIRGMNGQQLEQQILAHRIDVLVDLAGHTARNRLLVFARKPAPVQVTYLGYPGTTGLRAIDYRLTDEVLEPRDEPVHSSERLVYLEGGFCCFAPPRNAPAISPLPARTRGFVTFGSLHKLAKVTRASIAHWCRVLQSVPGSRLLMFRNSLRESARDRYLQLFASEGIAPERIELRSDFRANDSGEGGKGGAGGSYLSLYDEIDISLDVIPWSGHTTACEALWMGVPIVTPRGSTYAGRLVASILTQAGLSELIGSSPEECVEILRSLALDFDRLKSLRGNLRPQLAASLLCDGSRFTRKLEAAHRNMWAEWCSWGET